MLGSYRARLAAGAGMLCRGLALALMLAIGIPAAGAAPAAQPKPIRDYATAELIRGFMLTVFGREGPASGQAAGRYANKFIDPVTVNLLDAGSVAGRAAEAKAFVRLLARTVPNLTIRMTDDPARARIFLFLVDRSNYRKAIADALPKSDQTTFLEGNRCSTIMWNRTTGVLDYAYVFILADQGDAAFTSCLAEELTQALGPANDSSSLGDSLYNDTNDVGAFGLFDWYILSALYDRAIMSGMTAAEARAVLPAVIERLRRRVASVAPQLVPLPARR